MRYVLILLALLLPTAMADDLKYYDIYLTDNRVCKKCAWQVIDANRVELVSRKTGKRGIYHPSEIMGVDKHPIARRLFKKAVHGSGYAGKVIDPDAYDRPDLPTSAHP